MGKRNQSILNEEVTFNKDEELVSTTDLRGVITYANDAFVGWLVILSTNYSGKITTLSGIRICQRQRLKICGII